MIKWLRISKTTTVLKTRSATNYFREFPAMKFLILHVCLCFCLKTTLSHEIQEYSENTVNEDTGPLILTPLIKSGKIDEARKEAEVHFSGFKNIKSYSGYFTVSERYNSNMFFWFFPSERNYETAPVILWLQGGPGASSLIGLFLEIGPFRVKNKHGVKLRTEYWSQTHSVIYVDNPVGTGFSFTNKDGHAQNQTIIGEHMYEALLQFFQLFPELQKNEFYIAGESYAGKYVPAVSYHIMKQNPGAKQKINLQGLAIGNGLCDPENQMGYPEYLFQLGLIDSDSKAIAQTMVNDILGFIKKKQWEQAYEGFGKLILEGSTSFFHNVTGFNDHFNYLEINDSSANGMFTYLKRADVREAIHVGKTPFNDDDSVLDALKLDFMQSVAPLLSELLDNYRVLFYNGQLDIILAYPFTLNFIQKLNFKDAKAYKMAKRNIWYLNGDIAGYVKEAGKITEIMVRNAGHLVPRDQPSSALEMINRFTHSKSYH